MATNKERLEQLEKEREYKESLKYRNQSKRNTKQSQIEEEEDIEQFIDDSQDNLKNQQKYKHKEDSEEEGESQGDRKINEYLVQKKQTKQTTGIVIQDEEIEEVAQQEIQEVKITQIVKNQEELYMRQYDQPMNHEEKKDDLIDIDMDELLEQIQAKQLQKEQQQPVQKKIQAPHRQLRIEQEAPQIRSTINEEQIFNQQKNKVEITDILEANKSINFYWLDIYEDQINFPGELFLFGKVKNHKYNCYDTCTLCFKDYPKIIYLQYEGEYTLSELNDECKALMKHFLSLQPGDYKTQIVEKQYAFEIADISTQKDKYLEVTYTQRGKCQIPLKIPQDRSFFRYALQSTQSTIEQFLINNYIMGPCWLQVRGCRILGKEIKVSTQHALLLENHQLIYNDELNNTLPLPPLKVVSIAMKGCLLDKEESIIAISMAMQDNIDQEGKVTPERIHYRSIVRMPKDEQWPIGYRKGQYIEVDSERALLSQFCQIIERFDPDVLIGHDLGQRILVQIAGRMQKLRCSEWSRLSRLQRMSTLPKHANSKIRVMTIGRLLVDTYEMANELVKSNDYSLNFLAKKFLNEQSIEIESDVVQEYMSAFENIKILIGNNEQDARLTLKVMQKLDIISLTKQLTNIAGNVWNRSLQNQRAERNELLLMHEFYEQDYILPDRLEKGEEQEKSQYLGGLVFEPKADIYTDFVLLLDFNSLYPSIIMEKNICFTTVIRDKFSFDGKKAEQRIGEVDLTLGVGLLPKIIEKLINMRKKAKVMMAKASGIDKQVWNIKQLAVKLVANSIYGCLGFKSSRFYALPIASLITSTGRDILQMSKALVEKNHNVIYGDTDSMMIYPKLVTENKLQEVIMIGIQIKKQINQNYKKLQIDIDGLFTSLLLLRKKKYAGIKVTNLDDIITNKSQVVQLERETKGIDMVRREYCDFSKQMQSYVLDILLKIENRDNIFVDLYDLMQEIKNMIDYYVGESTETLQDILSKNRFIKKQFLPSQFIITKQLSKPPHEYADVNNHPHVLIAKRMIEQGIRTPESLVNHMIHYIICKDDNQKQLAFKAFTPEEMKENSHLKLDTKYYLQSQVFDPIGRLCKNINGLLLDKMAENLGLHYQKHQKVEYDKIEKEVEKEELLQSLHFVCQECNEKYSYDQIYIKESKQFMVKCPKQCKFTKRFENETKLLMKSLVDEYYRGAVQCHSNKEPTLCFSVNKKCFGTCCEEKNRKILHYQIKEQRINQQIQLLSKIVNKQFNQPFTTFDALNKLQNNVFYHQQQS